MTTRSKARSRLQTKATDSASLLREYFEARKPYIPATILGLASAGMVIFILTNIPPQSVANLPFPRTYAPLLISVGVAVFLLSSVCFLHRRRALLLTLWTLLILFLRLQQFSVSLIFTLGLAGILILIELLITRLTKRA